MKVHVFTNGKMMDNQDISFQEAMYLMETQQTLEEEPDNYIGFTAPEHEDAVIQFIRETKDNWIIDIPIVENDEYVGSLVSEASHSKIIAIVTNFFIKESTLRQAIVNKQWEQLQEEFGHRWGIGFHILKP